ncbi:MAG: hypothetical protein ACTHMT_12115 [Verrucomicrobiota bacterium]
MNPEFSKLHQKEQLEEELNSSQKQEQETAGMEFNTVEDLLRHDSDQNPGPAEVAERLNRSIAAEPKPQRSWIKKLFGS